MTVLLTQTALHIVLSSSLADMHNIFINYITEEKKANMHLSLGLEKKFLLIRLTDNFSTETPLQYPIDPN